MAGASAGRRILSVLLALMLAGCAGRPAAQAQTAPAASHGPRSIPSPSPWRPSIPDELVRYLDRLRAVSCPPGVARVEPEPIDLKASPVPLQPINPKRKAVGALTYLGGFHLTSSDKRFGGISDLKTLPNGDLLAETDQGDFVWIDLDKDGVTPKAARMAGMLDAAGKPLDGKREADAEGLAYKDGLAFISFERDHRVLAYDVGDCGAAARGAPIIAGGHGRPLPEAFAAAHIDVPENTSVEAIGITPDWYLAIGLEQQVNGQGPLSLRPVEDVPDFDLAVEKGAPDLVSIDLMPADDTGRNLRAFTLHRGFDQLLGNAIVISESRLERRGEGGTAATGEDQRRRERFEVVSTRRLAEMSILLTIDNYEGIAVRRMPNGHVRLYVVSDDNFSSRQRTLLMVFELAP